jgi:hypothetical protein
VERGGPQIPKKEPEAPRAVRPAEQAVDPGNLRDSGHPRADSSEEKIEIQPVKASLIIQYGPTLRSYKQLPVTVGRHPACDFKLDLPAILDQHAQIFFSRNQYWVKDLTGLGSISINGQSIGLQAPLKSDDRLSLTAQGPVFRFLGDGRLAEIPLPSPGESTPVRGAQKREPAQPGKPEGKPSGGLFSKVKKIFDS